MQQDMEQATVGPQEIKKMFDETLTRHMEQCVGANQGPAGLSLDMTTVSCVVILSEREIERESFPSDPPERFTLDSFLEQLEEMGLDSHEGARQKIKEMIDKGYIDMESDGKFLAGKPTMDMASLLDKAFPGMPGMNLIAYLVQILDEALSGRKDPGFAVAQLDQTLKIHGSGLSKKSSQPEKAPQSGNVLARKEKNQSAQALKSALSATIRKRQAETRANASADLTGQPRIVTAGGVVKTIQVKEVFPKHDQSLEVLGQSLEDKDAQGPTAQEAIAATHDEAFSSEAAVDSEAEDLAEDSQKLSDMAPEAAEETDLESIEAHDTGSLKTKGAEQGPWGHESSTSLSEAVDKDAFSTGVSSEEPSAQEGRDEAQARPQDASGQTGGGAQEDVTLLSDEALEERISAFEQGLAMICPVCNTGRIEKKETAKGKAFYVCIQQGCVFVSWGKPFHLECPRCKNPFLIEATGKAGKTMLRCPRATCRYQQETPTQEDASPAQASAAAQTPETATRRRVKKKRVVRRRVVRKKR